MARALNENEKEIFINNRVVLHEHLSELQADFEDFRNEDLLEYRDCMLKRVNECLKAILETDEDNLGDDCEYLHNNEDDDSKDNEQLKSGETYFVTIELNIHDDISERKLDGALADAIYDAGGEVVNIGEYQIRS